MKKHKHQCIRIFEHQTLRVGDVYEDVAFTKEHWQSLLRLHAQQYPPYFQIIHQGIKALHYVGSIAIPGLNLEILPKTDVHEEVNWQAFLLDILQATAKFPPIRLPSVLSARQGLLSDFFITNFVYEIEALCKAGLIKKYRRENRNERKFSGKMLLHEHVRHNYVHKERVFAEHQTFDTRHILHDFIKEALAFVLQLSQNADLQLRIRRLLAFIPSSAFKTDVSKIEKFRLGRAEAKYEKGLEWANFILSRLKPQLGSGSMSGHCFMIDMQQLFEEYVAMELKRVAPKFGCQVQSQARSRFWRQRSIRPDLLLTTASGETIILDTKWKMLINGQPGDADLKQIFIYNQFFKAERGILLYPRQGKSKNYAAAYHLPAAQPLRCELVFIDLLDEQSHCLSPYWAEKLLEQILMTSTAKSCQTK